MLLLARDPRGIKGQGQQDWLKSTFPRTNLAQEMFNDSYDKPLTMSAHVPAPTQNLSSYSPRGANDAAHIHSSGLGSQVRAYLAAQTCLLTTARWGISTTFSSRIFNTEILRMHPMLRLYVSDSGVPQFEWLAQKFSSQSSFRHPIPLVPENADYCTSGICPPRREQFPPHAAAASSHLDRHGGRQPAVPYGQTGPMNVSHIH